MQNQMRKNLKTILIIALVVSLAGATSAFALRGGRGGLMCGMGGMGMGPGMRWMHNLTPEQAAQVFDLRQKFMNETADIRKNIMVKRAELGQLWKAEKPDEKAILAKIKELGALQNQFMEKAVAQRFAMQKIVPEAMMGPGMMGPGMGPGMCPAPGFLPAPGPGQGKGPGPGADLRPGSDGMADYGQGLEMELTALQEIGW